MLKKIVTKTSFILYSDYEEHFSYLSEEELGKIMRAILRYQNNGEEPMLDGPLMTIFSFVKHDIEKNNEKWEKEKNSRSEAGKKGMESRWNKEKNTINSDIIVNENDNKNITNDNNVITNEYQNITNITDNVNVNVNVNDNVNVNNKDICISSEILVAKDLQRIINSWNSLNISKLNSIQNNRLILTRSRIKEVGIDKFLLAIENVRTSDFLLGSTGNFIITYDWFIRPNNFPKVLEGNYANKINPSLASDNSIESRAKRIEDYMKSGGGLK